jgi:hypothetical protein
LLGLHTSVCEKAHSDMWTGTFRSQALPGRPIVMHARISIIGVLTRALITH